MIKLHVKVNNSSTLFYVSVAKRAVQTFHSFEVNGFFDVFIHKLKFFVVECAILAPCAFVAKKMKKNCSVVKKSEEFD